MSDQDDHQAQSTEAHIGSTRGRYHLLCEALEILHGSKTIEETLNTACQYARKMVGADAVYAVLQEDNELYCYSDLGKRSHIDPSNNIPLQYNVASWAIGLQETTVISSTAEHAELLTLIVQPRCCDSLIVLPCQSNPRIALLAYWAKIFSAVEDDVGVLESLVSSIRFVLERLNAVSALQESEVRFRTLIEDTAQTIWEADANGFIKYRSAPLQAYEGRSEGESIENTWLDLVHPDDRAYVQSQWQMGLATRQAVNAEFRVRDDRSNWRWTHARATPVFNPDGSFRKWVGMNIDITDRKEAEARLRESEEFHRVSVEAAHVATWYLDLKADELILSPKKAEMLGLPKNTSRVTIKQWKSWLVPEDIPKLMLAIKNVVKGTDAIDVEYRIKPPGLEERWLYSRGKAVSDGANAITRLYGVTLDITERKKAEELIWRQANFDPLTHLPNRRLFHDRLGNAIKSAHRNRHKLALLFLDLDRFKQVNDLLGHDVGDKLLVEVANRLCSCVRGSDTVARLSGDEFTVVLTDVPQHGHIESVTQSILNKLSQPFYLSEDVAHISASIGAALYPDDGEDVQELMRKADQAMYAAKAAGRNRFSYFTKAMDEQAHLRVMLMNELRQALPNGQLHIVYQPMIDLRSNEIVKAEALLRWQHPRLGKIDPAVFVPLAEESGVINDIGNWVFQQAAMVAKRWSQQLGNPFQISVNRSPAQFFAHKGANGWPNYLEKIGLPGANITVEITEGLLMDSSVVITEELLRYHAAGIQVAIDDFGTGYSSMSYLKKFHVDFLKIDQSFIHDIVYDHTHRTIAESIIVMAHRLGMKVIAEGVENEEQRAVLCEAGCDYAQGFLFSKPVSAPELEAMLLH